MSRKERKAEARKNKRNTSSSTKKTWFKRILLILALMFLLIVIAVGGIIAKVIIDAPELKADDFKNPLSSQIYDQDGELVGTVFEDENRTQVDIDNVPDEVIDALISIEDRRFFNHPGVDYRRIGSAVIANVKHGWGTEGGSTITQQVIKRSVLTSEKTLTRKIQEAWLALNLEKKYSKEEILTMYLNNVYFGNGAYGIETAAETYFNKELADLSLSQTALLVGLPNAPSADDPFKEPERAENRRNQVLNAMVNNNVISDTEAKEAKEMPISEIIVDSKDKQESTTPYHAFIDTVYHQLVTEKEIITDEEFYQGGLKIYTTANKEAQELVYELLHSENIAYPDDDFETGIALIDTKSGAIKAIGGGRNFTSIKDMNYGSVVQHQPGSTIKPILSFGPAIEYLNWSTAYTINDEEYTYSDGTPVSNWDNQHWGETSMREALQWSRNIPTLKLFQNVGSDKAQDFAQGLGIEVDPIFESASLGGFNGASPLQMAGAYAAFGNEGVYNEPFSVKKIVYPDGEEWEPTGLKSEAVMHDYTAYMVTDMLKSVVTSGTGTQVNIPGLPIAGKTGTTNIPKDIREQYNIYNGILGSWFVGYTPEYSLAIWTGYPSLKDSEGEIQYMRQDGTQHIAKTLFKELISKLSDQSMEDFKMPDSVKAIGSELYIKGTQAERQIQREQERKARKEKEEKEKEERERKEKEEKEKEEREKKEKEEKEKEKEKEEERKKKEKEKEEEKKKKEAEKKKQEEQKKQEEREKKQKEEKERKEKEEQKKKEEEEKKKQEEQKNNEDEESG